MLKRLGKNHQILYNIYQELIELLSKYYTKGIIMEIYKVGGCVRDEVMGVTPRDIDYVVVGASPMLMVSEGYERVGQDFPVFIHPKTGEEYALARKERSTGSSTMDFSCETANVTLEEDLARRDLTMNAMAMNSEGTIIDPFDGQFDIENKVLRHTSEAFREDPVRVLRLARFRARLGYDWKIAPATKVLVYDMWPELQTLQPDRVWKELSRVLMEPHPRLFFDTLFECGVLEDIFPEIHNLTQTREGSKHHREASVYEHTMMMLELLTNSSKPYGLTLRLAVLFHDIGKPATYKSKGNSSGHEDILLVEEPIIKYIPVSAIRKDVLTLVTNHTKIYKLHEMNNKSIAKFLYSYKRDRALLVKQCDLAKADDEGRIADQGIHKAILRNQALKAYDEMVAFSPKEWVQDQTLLYDKCPSGEAIKQHIHKFNIACAIKHFEEWQC